MADLFDEKAWHDARDSIRPGPAGPDPVAGGDGDDVHFEVDEGDEGRSVVVHLSWPSKASVRSGMVFLNDPGL